MFVLGGFDLARMARGYGCLRRGGAIALLLGCLRLGSALETKSGSLRGSRGLGASRAAADLGFSSAPAPAAAAVSAVRRNLGGATSQVAKTQGAKEAKAQGESQSEFQTMAALQALLELERCV